MCCVSASYNDRAHAINSVVSNAVLLMLYYRSNPTPNNNSANGQVMNMDSCNDEALCRTGIKRKLSDSGDQDNLVS